MFYFSDATERNKRPILEQLLQWLNQRESVLEIGSASGQHGLYFRAYMPNLQWQFSDRSSYLAGLTKNLLNANLPDIDLPIELDVKNYNWSLNKYDVIFTANTLHIMQFDEVDYFLNHLHLALKRHGKLIIYGPFNYQGDYTSESNQMFDQYLKQQGYGGIQSFETLNDILFQYNITLQADVEMPANNRLLLWQCDK
ncbi:class I SAM-dependent methyltransferase [Thiotrichales bacterium 19S3-7]|nr:class I SAM-dependent methyltransferase [Thiotrichales bacterium 19S3-7]MCF6802314.1 class I SAM-dependent methyltransferase [Thiotrichales bacterium 19S3-11]